jgi:N-acetylmuramoyl-L-alanine amidase
MQATKQLIQFGVDQGIIDPNYELYGHRDLREGFDSPGEYLYQEICTWPHKAESKI